MLIEARDVSVFRSSYTVLDNVSLDVAADDFITLIGPNGAGKSMLLKTLLKLNRADKGSVTHTPDLKIGYVPEKIAFDRTMPMQVGRFLRLHNKISDYDLSALCAETGASHLLARPVADLSGGELQRVLLTRALIGNPHILMLDEPAQNLDVNGQLQFYKLLEDIYADREIAILMVSHDLHLVMSSTRKVVCLYRHICCSGTPESVAKDPEFISIFGDEMARLMAVYPHSHTHDHTHDHARKPDNS
ncbi:MAG: Zinc import ATP-binding protein ZnuC [Rhodobiaceae bacterium UBA7378]|nr:MAG: Zinc import ATP-binding protein ZnuC [Rhodobiaceae bacterium UBA7378]